MIEQNEKWYFVLIGGIKDDKKKEVGWVEDGTKKVSYQQILSISMCILVSVCVNI